jgi:hypothetical protein
MIIPLFVEGALLTINPLNQNVPPGSTVSVTLDISDVTDMYGWQFSIGYDHSIVSLNNVSSGPFLGTGGSTFYIPPDTGTAGLILDGGELLQGNIPGVSGSGTLLYLDFNAIASGISPVTIFLNASDPGLPTELIDSEGSLIAFIATNGIITVITEPVDTDGDGILDDGDISGIARDNPCTGGDTQNCDDNCPDTQNTDQFDYDSDGLGEVCDPCPSNPAARIASNPYSSIQKAYNIAVDLDIIESQDMTFNIGLLFDLNKSVSISGGYNCDYSAIIGKTIIGGDMIISNGVVTIQSGTLEVQ